MCNLTRGTSVPVLLSAYSLYKYNYCGLDRFSSGPKCHLYSSERLRIMQQPMHAQVAGTKTSTGLDSHHFSGQRVQQDRRLRQACRECRRRKIKCNRQIPCHQCQKFGIPCEPLLRKHVPKRPQALRERLAHLEDVLSHLAPSKQVVHTDEDSDDAIDQNDASGTDDSQTSPRMSTEVKGRPFFTAIATEISVQDSWLDDREVIDRDKPQDNETMTESETCFLLCLPSTLTSPAEHPNRAMALDLFEHYLKHVEPLFKVFHVPSLRDLVQHERSYLGSPPESSSNEAIKAVIYFAAVASMKPDELKERYGQLGNNVIRRLRTAADLALARADPMTTCDLGTLQALCLYVVSL